MPTKREPQPLEPTGAEIVDPDEDPLTGQEVDAFKRMGNVLRIIHGFDAFTPPSDEQIRERMIARKLAATNAKELLAGAEAEPLETFFQEPILIRGYDIVQSADNFNQAVFFALDITHRGEPHTVTTGAMDVMESVAIAEGRGFLPMMAVAYRSETATKAGFHPVKLRNFNTEDEPF